MIAKIAPNTQLIGQNIIYFNQIDSTNSFAQALIKDQKVENGTVIFAEEQTKGKGQRSKTWLSEPYKNLTFSIILLNDNNLIHSPFILNKLFTVSILQVLQHYLPNQNTKIKWPNDLIIKQKKICGILIENNFSGHTINYSVIGIGININQEKPSDNATSFFDISKTEHNRADVFKLLLEKFDMNYQLFKTIGSEYFEKEFNENLLGYSNSNQFKIKDRLYDGEIIGCDNDGLLEIYIQDKIQKFQHGAIQQLIYDERCN